MPKPFCVLRIWGVELLVPCLPITSCLYTNCFFNSLAIILLSWSKLFIHNELLKLITINWQSEFLIRKRFSVPFSTSKFITNRLVELLLVFSLLVVAHSGYFPVLIRKYIAFLSLSLSIKFAFTPVVYVYLIIFWIFLGTHSGKRIIIIVNFLYVFYLREISNSNCVW